MPRLEPEQEELLRRLVEAEKSAPRERRGPFLAIRHMGGQEICHPGFPGEEMKDFLWEDLDVLARYGFIISHTRGRGTWQFSISPEGREYYYSLLAEVESATGRIEERVRRFLDSDDFTKRHPAAYAAWREAESNLWQAEDVREFANIGYLCRQALQEFAGSLADTCGAQKAADKAKTKSQVRWVIAERRPVLGERLAEVLDGLATLWCSVVDLVQKLTHAVEEELELDWEDARRAVFLTAFAMFELDRALMQSTPGGRS